MGCLFCVGAIIPIIQYYVYGLIYLSLIGLLETLQTTETFEITQKIRQLHCDSLSFVQVRSFAVLLLANTSW